MRISVYASSDVGRVREGNEDSLFVGTTVYAVADGMGGHLAGEVASEMALEPLHVLDGHGFATAEEAEAALAAAVVGANARVVDKAVSDPSYHGMGTTLTAVLVRDNRLHVAHVGDSRAYLLRGNREMNQLTTDHTLVEELVRDGRITRDEAASHPQRSVITRAIGVDREVEVDALPSIELQPGDQVLLCSDGLTGPVPDRYIAEALAGIPDGDAACQALVAAANDAGGPDNITVILLRVEGDPSAAAAGGLPGTKAATLNPDHTEELVLDAASTASAIQGTGAGGDAAVPIRTRQESGNDWAESMRRFGAPQGHKRRPDHTGLATTHSRTRLLAALVAATILLGVLAGGGWLLLSRAYFVGDDGGQVAVFKGLPQAIGGVSLHWVAEDSDLSTEALPRHLRERVEQGVPVGSLREGRRLIENYRDDVRDEAPRTSPGATASEATEPATEPTGTAGTTGASDTTGATGTGDTTTSGDTGEPPATP